MKQKFLIVVVLFFMVFSSCKRSSDVEIGFLIHSLSSSRWQMDLAYVQERATELGANIELRNADGDENMQLKQASELLQAGVDVLIVVAANQNTAAAIVREAHDYGVKVISYDRIIKNADLDYLISFEYNRVGEMMVEYVTERKPEGNFILLWGDPSDANARFIQAGQERAIDPFLKNGKINLAYRTYVEGWSKFNSKHIVSEILDFFPGKIDAIVSSNDPMAVGAYEALLENGYKPYEVLITGQDATLEFCHSMLDGGMSMSVYKPIKDLARGAVDLAIDVAQGKRIRNATERVNNGRIDVPAILFKPSIVDKSNIDDVLISKGVFSHEQVYRK